MKGAFYIGDKHIFMYIHQSVQRKKFGEINNEILTNFNIQACLIWDFNLNHKERQKK